MESKNIENSRFFLLVFLVTAVTSIGLTASTITLLYDRQRAPVENPNTTTIVEKTVNRIIERTSVEKIIEESAPEIADIEEETTLDDLFNDNAVFLTLYYGSTAVGTGVLISPEAHIFMPSPLTTNRRYSATIGNQTIFYDLHVTDEYSILTPSEKQDLVTHVRAAELAEISLGEPMVILGGEDDERQVHFGHVSQIDRTDDNRIRQVKTSVDLDRVRKPSFVHIQNDIAGFVTGDENDSWVYLLPAVEIREFFSSQTGNAEDEPTPETISPDA